MEGKVLNHYAHLGFSALIMYYYYDNNNTYCPNIIIIIMNITLLENFY